MPVAAPLRYRISEILKLADEVAVPHGLGALRHATRLRREF
jgi:hypothetical protein